MQCIGSKDHRSMGKPLMELGDKLSTLAEHDGMLAEMLGENGFFALMQDPSKVEALPPPLQKGVKGMMHALSDESCVYSGAPLRINGRAIGTFCCFYSGLKDGEVSEANKQLQHAKADAAARIIGDFADTSDAGA